MLQQTQATKMPHPQHQQQQEEEKKTKTKFKVNSKQRQLLHLIINSRLHDISLFRWNAISSACALPQRPLPSEREEENKCGRN